MKRYWTPDNYDTVTYKMYLEESEKFVRFFKSQSKYDLEVLNLSVVIKTIERAKFKMEKNSSVVRRIALVAMHSDYIYFSEIRS